MIRHPLSRLPLALAAVAALAALSGCAAIEANRRIPGAVANGSFTPARAPAARFGDPQAACPVGGAYTQTYDKVAKMAADRGTPAAVADPVLCAMAEALLGWTDEAPPREAVRLHLARYFGSISPGPQVVISVLDSEDTRALGDALADTVAAYAAQVAAPRYGLATERLGSKKTRTVTVLDNARVVIDPLPRRLEPGQSATLSGTLQGDLESPKVVLSDTVGKVVEGEAQKGKAFKAELACGPKPGVLVVELRGEELGNEMVLSSFTVPCGGPALPTSVAVKATPWPEDAAKQRVKVQELIAAERATAGVPALVWNDAVGAIAQAVAESLRDAGKKGGAPAQVNVVQRLGDADLQAPVILQNPAAGPTAEGAAERLMLSPPHRANVLSAEVDHAGVGVALGTDQAGRAMAYLVELFIKIQPPPDVGAALATIRQAIDKKRAAEKVPELAVDAGLEKLAKDYAAVVAAAGGPPPKAKTEELVAALKKGYRDTTFMVDARIDLADFAEDPNALAKGKLVGLGGALGRHPRLGKNTLFVVLIIANKPTAGKK